MLDKKTIFSGIQPSGNLTIGNYCGAISNWIKLQNEYNCIFSIVDLHALTVYQEPANLRKNSLELLATYIACGINPNECTLFLQSTVSAHTELAWVLNTFSYIGELSRMTQFKDKSAKSGENINMGLMDYPVLMASDILLYQTDLVPVGADQKQHLELARDLANRFNNKYSPTFVVPEPYIANFGAKIYSLSDPSAKMSKSDKNENGYILINDNADAIMRKFKRAVTDSDNKIYISEEKKGITNLLNIYAVFSGCSLQEAESQFLDKQYSDLKIQTANAVIEALRPIQERQKQLLADKPYLLSVLKEGKEKAEYLANKTLKKVYKKIGIMELK